MFVYSDNVERSNRPFDPEKCCPIAQWLKHYNNSLYLQFIIRHKDTKPTEKVQATKEMKICERKLAYWARDPRWNRDEALRGAERLKNNWHNRK